MTRIRLNGDATTGEFTRRDFLGGAAAAGLILAISLPPRARAAAAETSELNAWLRIAPDDTITFIVDRSEMGQGVYTALPMLIAEELEVRLDAVRIVAAPVGDAYFNPGNGGQVTGTSNSVQDAWVKLRTAGAQARMMLVAAAAARWGVDAGACVARDGVITSPAGATLRYGDVAAQAARLPVPQQVVLKTPRQFALVGRSVARTDTPAKVDGRARYGIDVRLPGMLYAAYAQSPVLGGWPETVESGAAAKMPGVHAVLTTDRGVVVVADHFWQALKARDALAVIWNPGANANLDNQAIGAMLRRAAAAGPGLSARADGDADRALHAAARTVNAVYTLPLLAHATMEPMNCTADVRADGCDLYVGTQAQQVAQATAAAAAGMPADQVRVHTMLLGGGFGRRLDVDFIPAAVIASRAVGRPVQVIWTREDDMMHDTFRPPALEEISGGFDADGRLIAWKLHIVSPSITARMFPPVVGVDASVIEAAVNLPYEIPNVAVSYSRQEIGIDVGYMRSVSHAINCFVIESFIDELAAAAGRGPYEFRVGMLGNKPRHLRVLKEAARLAGWGSPAPNRHQGIALMEGYATHLAQIAEISFEDGALRVHRIVCVVDCGQMVNPKIVESQIEGGIVFGLSAALWGDITIDRGVVRQKNFDGYRVLRANEMPQIEVHLLASDAAPGGIGEVAVPLVAPAICNAVFAATGSRLRTLPIGAFKPASA
ncbi:MAG: xanthine dehydrogenase family protein molybdopterin-binding subunit [Gammaproteobacteria bacterium]|nr:xanthine dehydrogenase family protein molybdopterin-binding subunit [Gammaproteobacteria bacterium]